MFSYTNFTEILNKCDWQVKLTQPVSDNDSRWISDETEMMFQLQ